MSQRRCQADEEEDAHGERQMRDCDHSPEIAPEPIVELRNNPSTEHEVDNGNDTSRPSGSMIRRNSDARMTQIKRLVGIPEGNEREDPDHKRNNAEKKIQPTSPTLVSSDSVTAMFL